eukprot:2558565-Pyramimonas_sp.AAC.1
MDWKAATAAHVPFLFCTTTGSQLQPVSADSWRKAVSSHFKDPAASAHSFRRGGAVWFTRVSKIPPHVVQRQGGWNSGDVMRHTYADTSPDTLMQ